MKITDVNTSRKSAIRRNNDCLLFLFRNFSNGFSISSIRLARYEEMAAEAEFTAMMEMPKA